MGTENSDHSNVELVFGCYVQLELELAHFAQNAAAINFALGYLLIDESLELINGSHYKEQDRFFVSFVFSSIKHDWVKMLGRKGWLVDWRQSCKSYLCHLKGSAVVTKLI